MINLSKNAIRKYVRYGIEPSNMSLAEKVFLEYVKSGKKITLDKLQYIASDIKGSYIYDAENSCYMLFCNGYVVYSRKCKSMSISFYR